MCLNSISNSLILILIRLGILLHFGNFILREATFISDNGHIFGHVNRFVRRSHFKNTIRIDFKYNFDLRNSSRRRRYLQLERTQMVVIFCHCSLAFINLNLDNFLVILGGCEHFGHFGWFCSISFNDFLKDATLSFDTNGQRKGINQKNITTIILILSHKHGCLNRGTECDCFIRIDRLIQFFAIEKALNQLLNLRNIRRASN